MARTLKSEDKDHFFIVTEILNEPPIIVGREERQFASQQHTVICRVHLNFKKVSGVLKVTHGSTGIGAELHARSLKGQLRNIPKSRKLLLYCHVLMLFVIKAMALP